MAKFRKRPVVIEAFRLGIDSIPDWFMDKVTDRTVTLLSDRPISSPFDHDHKTMADIETLEGTHRANHGDYIIKGVKGELYPCKPDIFEMTYEEVSINKDIQVEVVTDEIEEVIRPLKVICSELNYDEAVVIGSIVGHLVSEIKRLRENQYKEI